MQTIRTIYVEEDNTIHRVVEGGTSSYDDKVFMSGDFDRRVYAEIKPDFMKENHFMVYRVADHEDPAAPFDPKHLQLDFEVMSLAQLPPEIRIQFLLGVM